MTRAVMAIALLLCTGSALAEPRIRVYADLECASTMLPAMGPPGPYIVYAMASLDTGAARRLAGHRDAEPRGSNPPR